ncbi:serine/threonine-protein kinase, partial [Streptomyces resistomycificus]|uniref:serine/threonine-protein kinase n=1 Tax=Streptomyces resistomycificus TaxID=67356 RepID=UPI0013E354D9
MSNDGGSGDGEGRTVGGRYRLVERIGSGGMGTVWRAVDELVEREVAVKQPRLPGDPESESRQRAAHRLYREARAAARVDHPSAVSIHDVVVEEEDGLPWIVMELVRGESMHELLQRGPLEPAEAARIGLAVLGALRAAHAVGIVHRDVKPANVLLGRHHRVVLTDFGIAHVQGEESLTVSGEFVGSLEFIAPERMSGPGAAGPSSDLWSLGVLLYAAVEGGSPFRRTTLESTLAAILAADPPEPKQAGPLGPLLVRLLAKDPERRPGPEEVAAVLEAAARERPVQGPFGDEAEEQDVGEEGEGGETQDTSGLREAAEDIGTARLRDAVRPPEPAPAVQPAPAIDPALAIDPTPAIEPTPAPEPEAVATPNSEERPPPRRRILRYSAVLSALLVGGIWFGTSSFGTSSSGTDTETGSAGVPAPTHTTPTTPVSYTHL